MVPDMQNNIIDVEQIHTTAQFARLIDHTLLKPDATSDEIHKLCREAREHDFLTVCVNPSYVSLCVAELAGSKTSAITVVGFPLGATLTEAKVFETLKSIERGATEIDMVLNIGALKSSDDNTVARDIASVVQAAGECPVKVILETALLTDDEKIRACRLSADVGAAYVKTSTGFSKGGATVQDIKLMRETVGKAIGVKASGGVRTLEQALAMLGAGASRIGASSSVTMMSEARKFYEHKR